MTRVKYIFLSVLVCIFVNTSMLSNLNDSSSVKYENCISGDCEKLIEDVVRLKSGLMSFETLDSDELLGRICACDYPYLLSWIMGEIKEVDYNRPILSGYSCLDLAIYNKAENVTRLIILDGAKIDKLDHSGKSPLKYVSSQLNRDENYINVFYSKPLLEYFSNNELNQLLRLAFDEDRIDLLSLTLEQIKLKSKQGFSVLDLSASYAVLVASIELFEEFLKYVEVDANYFGSSIAGLVLSDILRYSDFKGLAEIFDEHFPEIKFDKIEMLKKAGHNISYWGADADYLINNMIISPNAIKTLHELGFDINSDVGNRLLQNIITRLGERDGLPVGGGLLPLEWDQRKEIQIELKILALYAELGADFSEYNEIGVIASLIDKAIKEENKLLLEELIATSGVGISSHKEELNDALEFIKKSN